MDLVIGIILGLIGGSFLGYYLYRMRVRKQLNNMEFPAGLYVSNRFTVGKKNVTVRAEIRELKRTRDMVKIEVIDWREINISQTGQGYSTDKDKKEWKDMIDDWYKIDDERIKWFEKSLQDVREDKLRDILDKKW